jgi:hypothetical protein
MREENSKKRDCPDAQSAPLQSQKRHEADAIWPQEDGDHRSVEKIAEGDKSEWSKGGALPFDGRSGSGGVEGGGGG